MHTGHSLHRLRSLTGQFTLNNKRTLLYNLDKSDGICGGLLPSFDLSGVSRTTLVLGATITCIVCSLDGYETCGTSHPRN